MRRQHEKTSVHFESGVLISGKEKCATEPVKGMEEILIIVKTAGLRGQQHCGKGKNKETKIKNKKEISGWEGLMK